MQTFIEKGIDYTSTEPEVCAFGEHNGYNFLIIYTGSHPCAYIQTDLDLYNNECKKYCPAHGGFTFFDTLSHWSNNKNFEGFKDLLGEKWLGWDYGHYMDWSYMYEKYPEMLSENDYYKKWTAYMILDNIEDTIDWLRENYD